MLKTYSQKDLQLSSVIQYSFPNMFICHLMLSQFKSLCAVQGSR